MKNVVLLTLLFIALSTSGVLYAQTTSVTGTVQDDTGETLIGASVFVKEQAGIGTVTDLDGNYSLDVEYATPFTLVVSYSAIRLIGV